MTHAAGASHFYILNGAALFLSSFLSVCAPTCLLHRCREEEEEEEEASIHLTGTYVRYGGEGY